MFFGLVVVAAVLAAAGAWAPSPAAAKYASIIIDADTDQVLRSRNADTQNYPASLTKLMTLYLLFEAIEAKKVSLDTKLKVSRRAARQPPSKLGLGPGQTISVRDAIRALSVKSANDVAVVVAEALGGSERAFAKMMTKKARALGMSRTIFRNASGLPNRGQLSTARDIATLAQALRRNYPQYYRFFGEKTFRYKGKVLRSHNRLLGKYEGLDGLKTGYIHASGFNLAASAQRDGRRIVVVVFGGKSARSRDRHMVKLLDLGFERVVAHDRQYGRPAVADIPRPVYKPSRTKVVLITPRPKVSLDVPAVRFKPQRQVVSKPVPRPPRASEPSRPAQVSEPSRSARAASEPQRPAVIHVKRWGVQVGAYGSVTAAEIAIRRATVRAPLLADAEVALTPFVSGHRTLYRARLLGLAENEATAACRTLRKTTMPCVVIQDPDLSVTARAPASSDQIRSSAGSSGS